MFNTTVIRDNRTTKQEVYNHTETNVEASGNIIRERENTRFINIDKSKEAFKTIFSSVPFYIEKIQIKDGTVEVPMGRTQIYKTTNYKTVKTKISVSVNQVLVVGSDYTLEIVELSREDFSDEFSSTDKNKYFNTPTIL